MIHRQFVVIALGFVLMAGCSGTRPPVSDLARASERQLLTLEAARISLPGATLLEERSTPGRAAGSRPYEGEKPTRVVRIFSFEGDALATCQAVVDQLMQSGWNPRRECDPAGSPLSVVLDLPSSPNPVTGYLSVYVDDDVGVEGHTFMFFFETPYPSAG